MDTYRSIPPGCPVSGRAGQELREAELSWPNTDPQRSGCPRRRSFSQRAVCCPSPSALLGVCPPSPPLHSFPLLLLFDLILARIGCLPSSQWLLPTRQAAQPCRSVMKRGSSSGTARMLANCALVTQPHSMQPIDKASSESNLRESRRGLNVMR
ncbi:hypothetical protein FALCPG4_013552 [Fusarium falciforme]